MVLHNNQWDDEHGILNRKGHVINRRCWRILHTYVSYVPDCIELKKENVTPKINRVNLTTIANLM